MVIYVVMVTQQVIGLVTDIRQMKEKIKEAKNEQAHIDTQLINNNCYAHIMIYCIRITSVTRGEVSADLLSEVSGEF